MDADLYTPYALVVLDEATEEQECVISLDYAGLVYLRNWHRRQGRVAHLEYSVQWDYPAENVAADVAGYLAQAGL